ncbi:hypothetical protein BBJ28_00002142 [Nothophytophthora sp. Chile5]|nr:hypothetical protein BBJ28_00002142 [Nothophytophthora sp. Chile5]
MAYLAQNILKKYIERSGLEVVRKFEHEDATKNPEGYIEALVQVRNKYFELIKDAFAFHPLMRTALDQACRAFANSHPRLPELLAKYTHYLMSRDKKAISKYAASRTLLSPASSGSGALSEDALEQKIENVSVVFCLIDDKDIFKKYYSKFLAKRLIKGSSTSDDMEVLLIQKLRDICGCDFVSKLQKMLKDKTLSKELLETFAGWLEEKDIELRTEDASNAAAIAFHHTVSYHCDVLTAGAWPISSAAAEVKICLPRVIESHINLFTKFYTGRSTGRKLLWVHHLSFGMLQAHCFDKRYEFLLSFYQMLILLQSPKVAKVATREVEEDRKMALQASIVRVLKTRRDILEPQLMIEVAEMLVSQFVPTAAAIKQNVEILIQKEYLRRHESDPTRFLYVA